MNRFSLAIAAAMVSALPLAAQAAAPDARFDRAALADLSHARADLRPHRLHAAAAANWLERSETELLNRASFDARGALVPGQPVQPGTDLTGVMNARADLARHDLKDARHAIRVDQQQLRQEPARS